MATTDDKDICPTPEVLQSLNLTHEKPAKVGWYVWGCEDWMSPVYHFFTGSNIAQNMLGCPTCRFAGPLDERDLPEILRQP